MFPRRQCKTYTIPDRCQDIVHANQNRVIDVCVLEGGFVVFCTLIRQYMAMSTWHIIVGIRNERSPYMDIDTGTEIYVCNYSEITNLSRDHKIIWRKKIVFSGKMCCLGIIQRNIYRCPSMCSVEMYVWRQINKYRHLYSINVQPSY